ncbi:hypothetical protein DVH24_024847, partial [Malus domestica]
CSGSTHQFNLHRPVIVDEATEFFNTFDILDDDDNVVQDYDSPRTRRMDLLSMPTRGHFSRTFNCCCIVEYIKNDAINQGGSHQLMDC